MEKITVLYLIDHFVIMGGAEKNLFEVVTRLNPQRYKPIIMCLKGGKLVNVLRRKGIEIINLKIKKIYTPCALIKALKIIETLKKQDVKIVVTYHESSDFLGILTRLSGVPVLVSSRRNMGYKLKKRHIFIYRIINNLFDKIITVSDAVKNEIFNKENVLWNKLTTIYNGVEIEKFSRIIDRDAVKKSLALENDRPIVGVVASFRPIKGHKYFLEAASIIIKKIPKIYFLLVGWYDHSDIYYHYITKIIEKKNIQKNIILTGVRTDIPEMLSIMDICALPSINEGFPNAILEAMAAGKPVVATNSGGTPEAIVNGETGILVPPCNPEALANAILKLLRDKKMASNMGTASQERIKCLFNINKMMRDTENLYEKLLVTKEFKKNK